MASIVAYSRPLAWNARMVVATTVREIPKAWAICLTLKSVVFSDGGTRSLLGPGQSAVGLRR